MLILLFLGIIGSFIDNLNVFARMFFLLVIFSLPYLYAIFAKRKGISRTATWLSVLAFGAGQLYNRQFLKFIYFLVLYGVGIAYFIYTDGRNLATILLLVITAVSALDASKYAAGAVIRSLHKQREHAIKERVSKILEVKNSGQEIGVHTDILLNEPDLLLAMLYLHNGKLYLSKQVLDEIERLQKRSRTRTKAEIAYEVIEEFQRKQAIQFLNAPNREQLKKLDLNQSTEEKVIGSYLSTDKKIAFLSSHKAARVTARNAGLAVVDM